MAQSRSKRISRNRIKSSRAKEELKSRVSDFGEEVNKLGGRVDRRFKQAESMHEGWFYHTFGVVGPFLSSVFGLLVLLFFLWLINSANIFVGSTILHSIYDFLYENLGILFLISLFFSYSSYVSRYHRKTYLPFSPIITAISIGVVFWIFVSVIEVADVRNRALADFSAYVSGNWVLLFSLLVIIGYMVLASRLLTGRIPKEDYAPTAKPQSISRVERSSGFKGKRLYRSGKDKILGGVCGGIAEYLEVDPVLIRLVWVLATLAWGAGIVAYIIAWIIIPRDPRDKW